MVSCAESSSPRCRRLQCCGVLPALDLLLGLLRIGLSGLFQVRTVGLWRLAPVMPVMPPCTVPASSTTPAAATMASGGSALDEAPSVPAAAHSSEALAKPTN